MVQSTLTIWLVSLCYNKFAIFKNVQVATIVYLIWSLFDIDIIGQIVEVSYMDVISVNGKETPKISLELRNTK